MTPFLCLLLLSSSGHTTWKEGRICNTVAELQFKSSLIWIPVVQKGSAAACLLLFGQLTLQKFNLNKPLTRQIEFWMDKLLQTTTRLLLLLLASLLPLLPLHFQKIFFTAMMGIDHRQKLQNLRLSIFEDLSKGSQRDIKQSPILFSSITNMGKIWHDPKSSQLLEFRERKLQCWASFSIKHSKKMNSAKKGGGNLRLVWWNCKIW